MSEVRDDPRLLKVMKEHGVACQKDVVWHPDPRTKVTVRSRWHGDLETARLEAFRMAKEAGWTPPKWWQWWRWSDVDRHDYSPKTDTPRTQSNAKTPKE